jgi:hypothetical protein
MRIDQTHRPWLVWILAILAIATVAYFFFGMTSIRGPRAGSPIGTAFGAGGYALMLFAGLLGARKRFPLWRIGRAQTWMRGHVWLGLLSFALILLHAGFAFRGPLTTVLILLFTIVMVSGVAGVALQHHLPRLMTTQVPLETIYEEIPRVRQQLCAEADQLVEAAVLIESQSGERARFREIYHSQIRPRLEQPDEQMFVPVRASVPATFHGVLDDLEDICEEQRQLNRQVRLYHWLHGWLLVHVPLSVTLLVLGGVHAIMALRY